MKDFTKIPLRTDSVFADCPAPLGALWQAICHHENAMAAKLENLPEGSVATYRNSKWFLCVRNGHRELCVCEGNGIDAAMSRFDFGLECVDHEEDTLSQYLQELAPAVEHHRIEMVDVEKVRALNDDDESVEDIVAHAGELLIRAAAVIGRLTPEQLEEVRQRTDGGLPDSLGFALKAAERISPQVRKSLRTHPPAGFPLG